MFFRFLNLLFHLTHRKEIWKISICNCFCCRGVEHQLFTRLLRHQHYGLYKYHLRFRYLLFSFNVLGARETIEILMSPPCNRRESPSANVCLLPLAPCYRDDYKKKAAYFLWSNTIDPDIPQPPPRPYWLIFFLTVKWYRYNCIRTRFKLEDLTSKINSGLMQKKHLKLLIKKNGWTFLLPNSCTISVDMKTTIVTEYNLVCADAWKVGQFQVQCMVLLLIFLKIIFNRTLKLVLTWTKEAKKKYSSNRTLLY